MQRLKGLTWDHPRGYNALAAAARRAELAESGLAIAWEKQPLEGFESHPIADLCARYDLVVLDHPHVGEAVAGDCLQPLEAVFDAATVAALEADSIGPSLRSYRFAGSHWALPLDAATQVLAARQELLPGPVPVLWEDVVSLSRQTGKGWDSMTASQPRMTMSSSIVSRTHMSWTGSPAGRMPPSSSGKA